MMDIISTNMGSKIFLHIFIYTTSYYIFNCLKVLISRPIREITYFSTHTHTNLPEHPKEPTFLPVNRVFIQRLPDVLYLHFRASLFAHLYFNVNKDPVSSS